MSMPHLIVCERTGTWAAAIRRQLPAEVRLRQARGLAECATLLGEAPLSLVALELTAQNLAGTIDLVSQMPRRFPQARAIVVCQHGLRHYEWLLREAGAIFFAASTRDLSGVGQLVQNHIERLPDARIGLAAQIWDALPWGDTQTV